MRKKEYNFGEKATEDSLKSGNEIRVWQTPKYQQSKEKAIELIQKYEDINEGDFWILMNEAKSGKTMNYTGLIISHNACLKINDHLPEADRFVPSCVMLDKDGYRKSLVFSYSNDAQGIYEVGEVSADNCKNAYPYAMAYKRLFDRVVLKNSKIAYAGIYSDSEAEEFKEIPEEPKITEKDTKALVKELEKHGKKASELEALKGINGWDELTFSMWMAAMKELDAE